MTVKELKKLLKEFNDDDWVLLRWYTKDYNGERVSSERELEKQDCMSSNYNWKQRLILDATRL